MRTENVVGVSNEFSANSASLSLHFASNPVRLIYGVHLIRVRISHRLQLLALSCCRRLRHCIPAAWLLRLRVLWSICSTSPRTSPSQCALENKNRPQNRAHSKQYCYPDPTRRSPLRGPNLQRNQHRHKPHQLCLQPADQSQRRRFQSRAIFFGHRDPVVEALWKAHDHRQQQIKPQRNRRHQENLVRGTPVIRLAG